MRFDIGVSILSEYDADGFLGVQYDAEGEQQSGVPPYETHHFQGFISRPLDPVLDGEGQPDPTKCGQLLFAMEGGKGHAWAMEDPRVVPLLPTLRPGESMQYGSAGQFVRCHADGSLSVMTTTTGGAPEGASVSLQIKPDAFIFSAPFGTIRLDQSVCRIITQAGATFTLGAIGGLPAPLSAISSYCDIQAAAISLNASVVSLGPSAAEAEPAVKGTVLLAYLAEIAAALQTIATAVASASAAATTSGITPAQSAALNLLLPKILAPPVEILANTTVA